MVAEIGTYKGHPTITLKKNSDDEYGFTFGKTKAQLILQHLEEIKEFAEENKNERKKTDYIHN